MHSLHSKRNRCATNWSAWAGRQTQRCSQSWVWGTRKHRLSRSAIGTRRASPQPSLRPSMVEARMPFGSSVVWANQRIQWRLGFVFLFFITEIIMDILFLTLVCLRTSEHLARRQIKSLQCYQNLRQKKLLCILRLNITQKVYRMTRSVIWKQFVISSTSHNHSASRCQILKIGILLFL